MSYKALKAIWDEVQIFFSLQKKIENIISFIDIAKGDFWDKETAKKVVWIWKEQRKKWMRLKMGRLPLYLGGHENWNCNTRRPIFKSHVRKSSTKGLIKTLGHELKDWIEIPTIFSLLIV